jgi:mannose-6-phosphate isomerase-like protein (cupin superfamily)
MSAVFPQAIAALPEADVPLAGVRAYLSQSDGHQILFMEFERDVTVPSHSHGDQWAIVVAGRIDLVIAGERRTFRKGDCYFIPAGVEHSASVSAGYADVTFFADRARYLARGRASD